jgi:hypothetical protein
MTCHPPVHLAAEAIRGEGQEGNSGWPDTALEW